MPQPLRIALALVAGFLALNIVSSVLGAAAAGLTHPQAGNLGRPYMLLNVTAGLLAAVAGGAVAAMVARGSERLAGALLAVVLLAFGVASFRVYGAKVPAWYAFSLAFLSPLILFVAASLTAKYTTRRLL